MSTDEKHLAPDEVAAPGFHRKSPDERVRTKRSARARRKARRRAMAFELAAAHARQLVAAPYNGILGCPPDWVPPERHRQFLVHRSRVLRALDPMVARAMLIRVIASERALRAKGCASGAAIRPRELRDSIEFLAELFVAVGKGRKAGLQALGGQQAVLGAHFHEHMQDMGKRCGADRKKKAKEDAAHLQREVARLFARNPDHPRTKTAVARTLVRNGVVNGLSYNTVRQRIQVPEET